MTNELTLTQYHSTMADKMINVTESASPEVNIWDYVEQLVREKVVLKYVLDNQLVEFVYRNNLNTYDHVLLPTDNENIFIVLVIDRNSKNISGHFNLDMAKEY